MRQRKLALVTSENKDQQVAQDFHQQIRDETKNMIGDIMYGNLRYEKQKSKPTKQEK
jgi:hypothetical protein